MCLLSKPGHDRARYRCLDASRHQAREETGSLDAVGEVVGVDGDDTAHAAAEVDGDGQRQRRAHRLARQREVGEVELFDNPDDRGSQRGFLVAGAGDDVGPAHAREVDRIDRERIGDSRDDELEVVELRAHRMHQH